MKQLIPEPFLLSPYIEKGEDIPIDTEYTLEQLLELQPLAFDIYYQLQLNKLKPWDEKNIYIPKIIDMWEVTRPIIAHFFAKRDRKQALLPMKKMIMLFLAFLFWVNGQPVPQLTNITDFLKQLSIKPVNAEERINYVLTNPNHHHAFTQLEQLYIELQKKYAVANIKR